jgi:hypothetical protein
MAIENFSEILTYLKEHSEDKDVKTYLEAFQKKSEITLESVIEFVKKNPDADKHFKSERDKAVTKAIETYKGKYKDKDGNFETILQAELEAQRKVLQPEETEEKKKIRMLEEKFAEQERALKNERLRNHKIKMVNEKKLPADIVDYIKTADDEESTTTIIESFAGMYNDVVNKAVESRLAGNVRNPQNSNIPPAVEADSKLSDDEYFKKKGITGR